jgi:hypothetical protein
MADQPPDLSGLPGSVRPEYEFDINENEVIDGLSRSMNFVGIIMLIFGGLIVLAGVVNLPRGVALLQIGQGVVMMLIGGWLFGAARSLKDVVRTEGNDITHLMSALRKLRSVYFTQAVLYILACVFVALVIVLAVSKHA